MSTETKVISWGRCEITFTTLDTAAKTITIPVPKEGSTQLEVQEGDVQRAVEEGGRVIAVRRQPNGYTLSFQVFYDSKLDSNEDVKNLLAEGMRDKNYKVVITPEPAGALKITIKEAAVSVTHSYTPAEGIFKNVKCEVITSQSEPITYK